MHNLHFIIRYLNQFSITHLEIFTFLRFRDFLVIFISCDKSTYDELIIWLQFQWQIPIDNLNCFDGPQNVIEPFIDVVALFLILFVAHGVEEVVQSW